MKPRNVVLVALVTAMLAACSKPTDATKENFAKLIGPQVANECVATIYVTDLTMRHDLSFYSGYEVDLTNGEYPVTVVWIKPPGFLRQLDALVSAGLLTGKDLPEDPVAHRDYVLRGHQQQRQYALTDEGRKALDSRNHTSFCAAHYKLDQVVNFTAPATAFGETMTRVTIAISAQDAPAWAHSAALAAAFPDLGSHLKVRRELEVPMVLMSDGWASQLRAVFWN